MTSTQTIDAIFQRTEAAGLEIPPDVLSSCAGYLDLLSTWNQRINLTALPLSPATPQAIDRLIVEPLLAAPFLEPDSAWADLGSGGGSPALPLKIARVQTTLTMVESKERKSAFLREVIRVLHVVRANVFTGRFEDAELVGLDAVTIRAVKLDASAVSVVGRMLRKDGLLLIFGSAAHSWAGFLPDKTVQLPGSDGSKLLVLRKL